MPDKESIVLRVHLIGEVEVRVGKSSLALGTPKQQVLLAMLAIQPGRVVGLNELIDELWPVRPPDSAVANTRTYAANLRRFQRHPEAGTSIERTGGGYRFLVESDRVDLIAFGNECDRARIALEAGDLDQSETAITLAESYWRGPIFAGLPRGPILGARSAAAAEQRLALTEQRAEIHLLKGRARSAVSTLRAHAELHPLRERAQTLFVRALYEVGDAAAALQPIHGRVPPWSRQWGSNRVSHCRGSIDPYLPVTPPLPPPWDLSTACRRLTAGKVATPRAPLGPTWATERTPPGSPGPSVTSSAERGCQAGRRGD